MHRVGGREETPCVCSEVRVTNIFFLRMTWIFSGISFPTHSVLGKLFSNISSLAWDFFPWMIIRDCAVLCPFRLCFLFVRCFDVFQNHIFYGRGGENSPSHMR